MAIADGNLYIAGTTGAVTAVSLNALQLAMPSSYQLFRGVPVSGGLGDMLYSDGQALTALPGPTLSAQEAPIQVILTGTSVLPSPSQLKFHLQGFVSEHGLTETIDLWNYNTSAWVNISTTTATTTDSVVEAGVSNAAPYLGAGGQMRARVSWKALGPLVSYPWRASIDQAVWLEE